MSLSSRQARTVHKALDEKRRQLETDLAHFETWSMNQLGFGHSLVDDASIAFDQATQLTLRQNTEVRLAQVRHALGRLELGMYGICEGCGQLIDPERLLAVLDARLCLNCQRLQGDLPWGDFQQQSSGAMTVDRPARRPTISPG